MTELSTRALHRIKKMVYTELVRKRSYLKIIKTSYEGSQAVSSLLPGINLESLRKRYIKATDDVKYTERDFNTLVDMIRERKHDSTTTK